MSPEKKPLFSIIVPVYNTESFLNKCIDSILAQTFTDFELILVDDGSKDNSLAICRDFEEIDSRVSVIIHPENKGLCKSRDDGLCKASGDYIVWVDSDDFIDENRLSTLYNEIQKTKCDVVITKYIHECENGKQIIFSDSIPNGFYSGEKYEEIKPHIMEFNRKSGMRNIHTVLWNKAFKSELMKISKYKIPLSVKIGEDTPRTFIALLMAKSISLISDSSYHYVQRPGQMMKVRYENNYWENAMSIYSLIRDMNNEYKFANRDISYEINQNICIDSLNSVIMEINHSGKSKEQIISRINEICDSSIFNMAASKDLIKKQAFYFKPGLHAMKNSSLKTLRAYAMVWKLLMG